MRTFLLLLFFVISLPSFSQYYYKDIIGGNETSMMIKEYQDNKVVSVILNSFDAANSKNNDFYVEQQFNPLSLKTITRSNVTNESVLTSYIEKGRVIRTVDSSDALNSVTNYTYNIQGQLISTYNISSDTSNSTISEEHIWEYNKNIPIRMLRIKNRRDTIFINFKSDQKGNIVEEQETHNHIKTEPVYYYYDSNNRLTDIVRFNKRANRLLPEYMFEYSSENKLIQQITVPANNSEYLIWRYQYNEKGLKVKEAIYNRQKQLNGTITYSYTYGS